MSNFRRLFAIALPIILQQFISSSLNLLNGLMIGQLGETSIAAVGLSNQVFFVMVLFLFGITSGSAIFTAQLWGKRDIANIHRVIGLTITLSLAAVLIFFCAAVFFPELALGIYTRDPAVIETGSSYLRIIGWSYLFTAVSFSFSSALRSTGDVRTPLVVSLGALSLAAGLGYVLIFGKFGFPALGVPGAAIATSAARVIEAAGLVILTYWKRSPIAAHPREMFSFDLPFTKAVLRRALPVGLNELFWALGTTTYNVIYARIGTAAIAAVNISSTIESLVFVIFIGISEATAILVGNEIGAGKEDNAFQIARGSLFICVGGGLLMGLLVYILSGAILDLYRVSPQVIDYAHRVLIAVSLSLWLRVSNMLLFVGILRSGGDTRFGFILDSFTLWLIGVPLAYVGAFVLHLPVYWVYPLALAEEFVKWLIVLRRFFSRRWIHNVTHALPVEAAAVEGKALNG